MLDYDYKLEKIDEYKKNIIRSHIYNSQHIKKYKCCPYCGKNQFIKHGRYNGIQRYRCKNKNCRKTFSNTTNSVWKYLKHEPEKWIKFIEFMAEGYSLEICARVLEISVATAFYWRHKLLHAVEKNIKPKEFVEMVNIKYVELPKCYKGSRNKHYTKKQKYENKNARLFCLVPYDVRVLVAREKNNIPLIRTTQPYETFEENIENNVLSIAGDNCFVHQHHARIAGGCKPVVEHNKKLPRKIKKKYGFRLYYGSMIDKIPLEEEYTPRYFTYLFTWISRFRGIATKYVDHYFNFYSLIDAEEHFDYIGIFFRLLKNCLYTSIENLKKLHVENY